VTRNLDFQHLARLLSTVFGVREPERDLTLLIDLPTPAVHDTAEWMDRRRMAAEWFTAFQANVSALPYSGVSCCVYDNVGTNNGDLPSVVTLVDRCTAARPSAPCRSVALQEVLGSSSVVLALTELSATAPLKMLGAALGFRGASMPGFSRAMIPALGLDYEKVDARVRQLQERMNRAVRADLVLRADGSTFTPVIDLRFRTGHASGGLMRSDGVVANLPSGEAYIVPYEGEKDGVPSATEGDLPVQFGQELVVFRIRNNRAVDVVGTGHQADQQRRRLRQEPAYGNIAELGIGVLSEWGVTAVGRTLLDEKLGLHVAFGRSDHFGGVTGPSLFSKPKNVVHIDWVYVPSVQPAIHVASVTFSYEDEVKEQIITDGKLAI
jgi:hypothetical protein